MESSSTQTKRWLHDIWQAGVGAVRADRLVRQTLRVQGDQLHCGDLAPMDLATMDKICVVGAGKAAAAMAIGVEQAIGKSWADRKQLSGWVNVPDGCWQPTQYVQLHIARQAGQNEPTPSAEAGTRRILRIVQSLGKKDLCIVLLSGGGSALMPAPVPGVTLTDKLIVTRLLSDAGASIHEINAVRRRLSRVKAGGLLHACRAGQMVSLIISDVVDDRLETIASGPTVTESGGLDPVQIVKDYDQHHQCPPSVLAALGQSRRLPPPTVTAHHNLVIGNNATAVAASRSRAIALGCDVEILPTQTSQLDVAEVAMDWVNRIGELSVRATPVCLINGGEPTVKLVPKPARGLGGRNQQLVLAVLQRLLWQPPKAGRWGFMSAGTDGEDGVTDAAGALIWAELVDTLRGARIDFRDFLARNDAFHALGPLGGLFRTGFTNTNVCDLAIFCQFPP